MLAKRRTIPIRSPEAIPEWAEAIPDWVAGPAGNGSAVATETGGARARSASFGSYEEAKQAARTVHDGASSGRFEDRSGGTGPVDLPARRDAARLDAERWLDEGGSFSRQAVSR
jgi:hypothetical protein